MDAPSEITLTIRHKGILYTQRHTIYYTGTRKPNSTDRELGYQVAAAWAKIKRDIEQWDRQSEKTNPFAWSRGPVGD